MQSKHCKLKAPTKMAATEVKLDKLYLARLSYGSWTLVKVLGAKTQGWLRGNVNIRGFYTDGCGRFVLGRLLKRLKLASMLMFL